MRRKWELKKEDKTTACGDGILIPSFGPTNIKPRTQNGESRTEKLYPAFRAVDPPDKPSQIRDIRDNPASGAKKRVGLRYGPWRELLWREFIN